MSMKTKFEAKKVFGGWQVFWTATDEVWGNGIYVTEWQAQEAAARLNEMWSKV